MDPKQSFDVRAFIEQLEPLYRLLFPEELDVRERCRRASFLFPRGPRFVRLVATALSDQRDLFPDVPADPAVLFGLQAEADDLRRLSGHLLLLHRLAYDGYLDQQAQAIERAHNVYRKVHEGDQYLFGRGDVRYEQRRAALAPAEDFAPQKGRRPKKSRRGRKRA